VEYLLASTGHTSGLEHFLASVGYAAVFTLSFISSMGLPVGAELALIFGGVLASTAGAEANHVTALSLPLVIVAGTLGELLGSLAGYAIGRYGGRPLVDKFGKYLLLTHKDLDRADAWFARRGEPVVFFGRFIPLLRSFVSFAAGLGEMTIGKFTAYTAVACAIWVTALCSLGYSLGSSYEKVLKAFSYAGYVIGALAVIAVAFVFWHRWQAYRRERDASRAETQI
jgi:membrane protein DedA with SNARE-associated domain